MPWSDLRHCIREGWLVLLEQHDHPHPERHRHIIAIQHHHVPFQILGFLQLLVVFVELTAKGLHREHCEEEHDDTQHRHHFRGGLEQLRDGLDHELHRIQLLQLLDHPEEPQKPQHVRIGGDVIRQQTFQETRAQQEHRGEEIELVAGKGPILFEGHHGQLGAHLAQVDEGKCQLEPLEARRLGRLVEVEDGLNDDEGQIHQEHNVHHTLKA
mmetsp:Transcript_91061/g.294056  ORF Transcript_91061/g.294056 Transcript_91061/m.294056 type:complete len:212 (-) Transcript_91061:1486-2121(-)